MIDDLVDIACQDDYLRKKTLFTSNKNSTNTEMYSKVVRLLSARSVDRGEVCEFTVVQKRIIIVIKIIIHLFKVG